MHSIQFNSYLTLMLLYEYMDFFLSSTIFFCLTLFVVVCLNLNWSQIDCCWQSFSLLLLWLSSIISGNVKVRLKATEKKRNFSFWLFMEEKNGFLPSFCRIYVVRYATTAATTTKIVIFHHLQYHYGQSNGNFYSALFKKKKNWKSIIIIPSIPVTHALIIFLVIDAFLFFSLLDNNQLMEIISHDDV